MPFEELRKEIEDGIVFWGLEHDGQLLGVIGIQDKGEVTIMRHAYVRTRAQKMGIGTKLLWHLESVTDKPILIGTWQLLHGQSTFMKETAIPSCRRKKRITFSGSTGRFQSDKWKHL